VESSILDPLAIALKVDDLDLPAAWKSHVVVYALVVVLMHRLSAALIDPWPAGL
jgi:hypothetical protein